MKIEFSGCSGCGKTTIANKLCLILNSRGFNAIVFDEWFYNKNKIKRLFLIFRYCFLDFGLILSLFFKLGMKNKCYLVHFIHHIAIENYSNKFLKNYDFIIFSESFSTMIPNLKKIVQFKFNFMRPCWDKDFLIYINNNFKDWLGHKISRDGQQAKQISKTEWVGLNKMYSNFINDNYIKCKILDFKYDYLHSDELAFTIFERLTKL